MAPGVKYAASKDAAFDHPTTSSSSSSSSDGDKGTVDGKLQFMSNNGEDDGIPEKRNRVSAVDEKPETRSGMTLRPRKSDSVVKSAFRRQSSRLGFSCETRNGTAKGNQRRFRISLTKEEIEEDIFFITGSRTHRQIKSTKQRSTTSRRHLETLFPGSKLHLITPERYKVRNNHYH